MAVTMVDDGGSCDKCGEAHAADASSYYKGNRDEHPDGKKKEFLGTLSSDDGNTYLARADVAQGPNSEPMTIVDDGTETKAAPGAVSTKFSKDSTPW
ncbi:hypothetical protein M885DRAFT_559385 [Pelagophyceae sp. CCMP2097]|nr:hypothetical protein M885DRAFT_559385 [Pelagophyceae sp. CCMP2097]